MCGAVHSAQLGDKYIQYNLEGRERKGDGELWAKKVGEKINTINKYKVMLVLIFTLYILLPLQLPPPPIILIIMADHQGQVC